MPTGTDLTLGGSFSFCLERLQKTSGGAVSKRSQASCVATIDTGRRNALRGVGSVVTDGAGTQTVAYERLVGGGCKARRGQSGTELAECA